MITPRPSEERGHTRIEWLDSRHSFSFGEYHDPRHMGFSSLRVINEDVIAPGMGFGSHPHRDMEIVTVVLSGALQHRDSLGNGSVIRPGDVQRMTAGRGIRHSEFNASHTDPVHLLQIWITPHAQGLDPGYEQKAFPLDKLQTGLLLLVSPDGRNGSVTIHQDASIYHGSISGELTYPVDPRRNVWVQATCGRLLVNGLQFGAGDGASITGEREISFLGDATEILLFDLP